VRFDTLAIAPRGAPEHAELPALREPVARGLLVPR
jgi:hypothetical protein